MKIIFLCKIVDGKRLKKISGDTQVFSEYNIDWRKKIYDLLYEKVVCMGLKIISRLLGSNVPVATALFIENTLPLFFLVSKILMIHF